MKMRAVTLYLTGFLFSLVLCACTTSVKESDYASKIIGTWEGKGKNFTETITFKPNGTFFAKTLKGSSLFDVIVPGHSGSFDGFWRIDGKDLSLRIAGEMNFNASKNDGQRRIVTFREFEFAIENEKGDKQYFYRFR